MLVLLHFRLAIGLFTMVANGKSQQVKTELLQVLRLLQLATMRFLLLEVLLQPQELLILDLLEHLLNM